MTVCQIGNHRRSKVFIFAWAVMGATVTYAEEPAVPHRIDKPLVAQWHFDQPNTAKSLDSSDNANHAVSKQGTGIRRVPGLFGDALRLSGNHMLHVPGRPDFGKLKRISFSAWTRPTRWDGYNEIFRKEDGNRRVLFSFQENGRILSLGLNIGGYIECDAPIDLATLMDGRWHHCAATFDGQVMRVYLDGRQIGSRTRRGDIVAGGTAPGCIGSSNGHECFQGSMDDLRIYSAALTADEVVQVYRSGGGVLREVDRRYETERLIELLVEFMPLTDAQWARQSPVDRKKWQQVKAIREEYKQLKKLGDDAKPETWAALLLQAEKHKNLIQERPRQHEAVAPYIEPTTPETRDLSRGEARDALERDWMHQASNRPSPTNIRNEIRYARQIAGRIRVAVKDELAELDILEKKAAQQQGDGRELYLRVRQVKRRIMFKNPVLDFDRVLLVDMPYPGGSEWRHETRHRLGYMAVPGARLLVLKGLSPGGKLKQLMPIEPLHGSFWRPDVSYDGKHVLFCFKPHNEKSFHLYEIHADGTHLRQLTDSVYDDLDPIYLPDGKHILFSTSRGHTYVRCMPPTNAYVLGRCDTDGNNIYLISRNNEPDYLPSVMNDGRVIYTRWEYTDKPLWRAQGLWTVNPDGTQVNVFWGNQSVWPDLLKDARSIPNSNRIMFTGSAHHDWFSGSIGIIDSAKGFNFPNGVTKVTAEMPWPESGNGPVDPIESPNYHASGKYDGYYSPYPIGPADFLVSANRGGKFILYLMDVDGNRELIYEGHHNILHAMPLKPRMVPPVRPDGVIWPTGKQRDKPKDGIIFSNNVYDGVADALRDKARFLRVLTIDAKTYTYWYKRPYISTGPVVSGVQSEGVKRILGTVPIEKDGSLSFFAPSGIPLHFQLLDEQYRALQTMRSFTGVMPGERRGCVGCHESRSSTPQSYTRVALARHPTRITPPPWGEDTVSFERYVRPVLKRYCSECHEGDGDATKTLDLSARPGKLGFDQTYWLLTGNPTWGKPYRQPANAPPGFGIAGMLMVEGYDTRDPVAYQTPKPMTRLSYKSPLIDLASSGKHYKVKVDALSLRKLIAWVDTMCPYRGDEEVRQINDPKFQGVDWLSIKPRIKTAPRVIRPGPVDEKTYSHR